MYVYIVFCEHINRNKQNTCLPERRTVCESATAGLALLVVLYAQTYTASVRVRAPVWQCRMFTAQLLHADEDS